MSIKNNIVLFVCVVQLLFFHSLSICVSAERETVFDRIEAPQHDLVRDIPYLPPLCDDIPNLKKGFINLPDGASIYYEEEGRGTPLVLISGGPGGTHQGFHADFSRMKTCARVIYYDQRGVGKKSSIDPTGKTYTIQQAVEDLENIRKALRIKRWVVLGWSYGGLVAQCYALTYPQQTQGLVLGCSCHGAPRLNTCSREKMFLSPGEKERINHIYDLFFAGAINSQQWIYNRFLCGHWKQQLYYKPENEEAIRKGLYGWLPAAGFQFLIAQDKDRIDLTGMFNDFDVPTLVCESTWDLTWDAVKMEFMKKNHPHAQVEVFEKSGHCVFHDEPDTFFPLLESFIRTSKKSPVSHLCANRSIWPKRCSDFFCQVAVTADTKIGLEREKALLNVYNQAVQDNATDVRGWSLLARRLFDLKSERTHTTILDALDHLEQLLNQSNEYSHELLKGKIIRGHVLDLMGKRAEALVQYQEALRIHGIVSSLHKNAYEADKKVLEKCLSEPFKF
ncbi:MAG: Alpha/beta hydrolase fold containing protein [candidate division TM6 bacterium GW2011_GWE2_41_16]|nr:MAG: Alpha/beta hydrolase fold containing protein [candidate division TM6 bacterium GW2011_GWE2_41_16]